MKFTVRAETPLLVGAGERLAWLDWALYGNKVRVLDWGAIIAAASEKSDDVAEALRDFTVRGDKIIHEGQKALKDTPGNERSNLLRQVREKTNADRFAKDDLKNAELANEIRDGKFDRYSSTFGGGRLDRALEITTCAKDNANAAIIPASTVRGQIRSALLHALLATGDEATARRTLDGLGPRRGWEKELATTTPGRARFQFGADLESAAFRVPGGGPKRIVTDDPRVDLMRFIRVSEPVKLRSTTIVLRVAPFAVRKLSGEKRPVPLVPTVSEAIAPGSEFEFELTVDTELLKGVAAAQGNGHAFVRAPFWELIPRVFGLDREEVKSLDSAALEERVVSAIEVALSGRMAALARRDVKWFDRHDVSKEAPQRQFVEAIVKGDGERLPMRIGAGAGLHGVTAIASIELDPLLADPLARIMARTGLGMRPKDRRERAEREKHAIEKSRRSGRGGGHGVRAELLAEKTDPKILPQARRLEMDHGGPGDQLGMASYARGELSAEAPKPRVKPKPKRTDRDADRPQRRHGKGGKPDRTSRPSSPSGPRRSAPRRPPVPDRPANQSEVDDLLKKFGPRF